MTNTVATTPCKPVTLFFERFGDGAIVHYYGEAFGEEFEASEKLMEYGLAIWGSLKDAASQKLVMAVEGRVTPLFTRGPLMAYIRRSMALEDPEDRR